jgi:hypothetical protein
MTQANSVPQEAQAAQALPNLKGLVTKEMVKTIGTGKYAATYTPWAKIAELLNDHAPGWQAELIPSPEGVYAHRAPIGGYLVIRFKNIFTGAVTTEWIQSIQDNRHQSIPWDKIDSRDISDTSRRGLALAAAAVFNLGIELWTRDPLESGYSRTVEESDAASPAVQAAVTAKQPTAAESDVAPATAPTVSKEAFLEAALERGLTTHAAESLAGKLKGNFAGGIDRLKEKDDAWVESFNEASAPKNSAEQW